MQIGSTRLSGIDIGVIILTLITAIVHLFLGISTGDTLFLLNGLGYIGLLVIFFLPMFAQWHGWIRWLFIGYTILTIVLYFLFSGAGSLQNVMGLVTKAVEVILVVLLFLDR